MKETFFTTSTGKPDISSIIIWSFLALVSIAALFVKLGYDNAIIVLLLGVLLVFTGIVVIESVKLFKN